MNNSKSIIIAGVLLNFLAIAFAVTAYLSTQNQTLKSQATGSSSFTSAEAENATLSGPVVVGNDSAASNGRYIAFSSSTNPTATPLPTIIPTTGPSPTTGVVAGCNYTINSSVSTADGNGNYSNVKAGDVVCITAGNRAGLKLINFKGASGAPITFINKGGKVLINDSNIGTELYSSQYVRITGAGDPNIFYGIEIMNGQNSGFDSNHGGTEYIEIDHLYIHDVGAGIRSAKNNDLLNIGTWTGHQFYYHDNYIRHTNNEGMYIGSSTTGGVFPIHDVQIYNNRVEDTGYDGIQVRQGETRVLVHHNIINGTGRSPCKNGTTDNSGGFNIAKNTNTGDWYSNIVIGAMKGAHIKDVSNIRFYNNVIIDSGHTAPTCSGTTAPEGGIDILNVSNVSVFNNTIINKSVNGAYGISVSSGANVRDNIIGGTFASLIKGTGGTLTGNLTNPNLSFFNFVNLAGNDFHLTNSSPAVDAASNSTFPPQDFDGTVRPYGSKSDVGAYEYHL